MTITPSEATALGFVRIDVDEAFPADPRGAVWQPVELVFHSTADRSPEVELRVTFVGEAERVVVTAFHRGDDRLVVRFLPSAVGEWHWSSSSDTPDLDGRTGTLVVEESDATGPVRVAERFHFRYANGERYTPFGTTLYAWIHQTEELQEATLATLASAPFNKIRMGVFPKSMYFNENEPELFPFARDLDGGWDTGAPDDAFFDHLEQRIAQLGELGIETEIILWHPYDRWGFADLTPDADERYLRYVIRRLAAFPHVWWSMANEFDVMRKTDAEWARLTRILVEEDHVGHLRTIHNAFRYPAWETDLSTHVSMQSIERVKSTEFVREWRERWQKPILVDEFRYEGDLEYNWGDISGQELVRRSWEALIRGGYVSHGETYWHEDDVVFWAKGGRLVGESPERLRFLRGIVAESPTGSLDPFDFREWDTPAGGIPGVYELHYLGIGRPRAFLGNAPEGVVFRVDVIDTWEMTVDRVPGEFTGAFRIELPRKPYMAVRLIGETASR